MSTSAVFLIFSAILIGAEATVVVDVKPEAFAEPASDLSYSSEVTGVVNLTVSTTPGGGGGGGGGADSAIEDSKPPFNIASASELEPRPPQDGKINRETNAAKISFGVMADFFRYNEYSF